MPYSNNFIDAIHTSHLDNGRMVYYATKDGASSPKPVMPATPFIFEYFLFNSIYQYDWKETDKVGNLHEYPKNSKGYVILKEYEQQQNLLTYLNELCRYNTKNVERAFAPFKYLKDLEGKWTEITPDNKLNSDDGDKFFDAVTKIRSSMIRGLDESLVDEFFSQVDVCREFVGKVRNNIFHGTKSLGQIWDTEQRRRIELYFLVIQSINSLFFLTRPGIKEVASDEVFSPMEIRSGNNRLIVSSMQVLELFVQDLIKREDPELLSWASGELESLDSMDEASGVLFYPSAGNDIITPVLLGLPFCSEFHFYDKNGGKGLQKALLQLRNILGNPKGFKLPIEAKRSFEMEFEHNGVNRRLSYTKQDNERFLESRSRLIFFFHRGDSLGEGGSDQPWDGDWYPRWKEMIPEGHLCAVLTDGLPYGVNPEFARHLAPFKPNKGASHHSPYRCGIIRP